MLSFSLFSSFYLGTTCLLRPAMLLNIPLLHIEMAVPENGARP